MKEIKTTIVLYKYEELTGEAKERAFNKHEDFLNSLPVDYENNKGELVEEYINHDKEAVEDSLKINEYYFFVDGKMADCVTYTGSHKKTGITEFKFQGFIYEI